MYMIIDGLFVLINNMTIAVTDTNIFCDEQIHVNYVSTYILIIFMWECNCDMKLLNTIVARHYTVAQILHTLVIWEFECETLLIVSWKFKLLHLWQSELKLRKKDLQTNEI
jgi:hypothetical protein